MNKKINLLIIIVFSGFHCLGQSANTKTAGFLSDLEIFHETINKMHSGMYLYTDQSTFDSLFTITRKKIKRSDSYSNRNFYLDLAKIYTKIGCGHSNLYYPKSDLSEIHDLQKGFLSIPFKFIKDTLIISRDFGQMKKGSRVISINGRLVEQIKHEAFQLISSDGYNISHKNHVLGGRFAYYYIYLYGLSKTIDLVVTSFGSNQSEHFIIDASLDTNIICQKNPTPRLLHLSYLNNETALLTVNSFDNDEINGKRRYFKFLKKSFKEIRKKKIKTLVLDIRENTGGNDGNDMELASYIINRSFKENKFRKLNTNELIYPEFLHSTWRKMMDISKRKSPNEIKEMMEKYINKNCILGEDGAYYQKDESIIRKTPNKYLFSGKIYVLISGKVFSGGSLFSALVRDKSKAIFVGEETGGGYYRHTGSIPLMYKLPFSGIVFLMSIIVNEQDVDQNLFPDGRGVIPHHQINQSIQEFIEGKDAEMEFVRSQIIDKD